VSHINEFCAHYESMGLIATVFHEPDSRAQSLGNQPTMMSRPRDRQPQFGMYRHLSRWKHRHDRFVPIREVPLVSFGYACLRVMKGHSGKPGLPNTGMLPFQPVPSGMPRAIALRLGRISIYFLARSVSPRSAVAAAKDSFPMNFVFIRRRRKLKEGPPRSARV